MAEQKLPIKVTHTLELGENAFWMALWTMVAVAVVTLALVLTNRATESDRIIAASADPVATACATGLGSTNTNQCTVLLARKN